MTQLINHKIRDDLVGLLDVSGRKWVAGAVGGVGNQAGEVEENPQDPKTEEEEGAQPGIMNVLLMLAFCAPVKAGNFVQWE